MGVEEDPQTALSFPSSGNFCHRTRPYGTPNLDFQRSYCFTDNHSNCPVFTRSGRAPLPANIRFQPDKPHFGKQFILPWLIGMLVLLGIMGALWAIQDYSNHDGSLFGVLAKSSPTANMQLLTPATKPLTLTPVPTASATATLQPPSPTPSPDSTLLPTIQSTLVPSPSTPTPVPTVYFPPSLTPTNTFIIPGITPPPPSDTPVPPPTDTAVPPTEAPTATTP